MNQHPVPQNVTQYQFRLVGDMTLKQFLELAVGLVLALLFYSSNLLVIFKVPLIILSVFFGIALAFFPIEDRPLDQWIINFINAIYKPTRFTWKKTNKVPNIFTFTAHPIAPTNTITKTIKAPIKQTNVAVNDLSEDEGTQLKSLNSLFAALPSPPTPPQTETTSTILYAKPKVSIRKLKPKTDTVTPPESPQKTLNIPPANSVSFPKSDKAINNSSTATASIVPENLIFSSNPTPTPKPYSPPTKTIPLKSISLPVSPRTPNLIVGVTSDKNGKLVEGAIVQVVDQSGVPARAMKTNALGQFATSTPLSPGTYRVEVEADGHTFPTQQLIVQNQIIQPFEIQALS